MLKMMKIKKLQLKYHAYDLFALTFYPLDPCHPNDLRGPRGIHHAPDLGSDRDHPGPVRHARRICYHGRHVDPCDLHDQDAQSLLAPDCWEINFEIRLNFSHE